MLRYSHVRTATHQNRIAVVQLGPDAPAGRDPVVFVHPVNLRKECWLGLMRVLAADRLCVALDLAGHGESSDAAAYSIEAWVRDCVEVIAELGLTRFHVVGGSLGGPIAVGIAATVPEQVLGITSLGGRLSPEPAAAAGSANPFDELAQRGRDALFREISTGVVAPGSAPELIETIFELTNSHSIETIHGVWSAVMAADAGQWAPDVRCRALIVNGEHDAGFTPAMGERLAAALGAPFVLMKGIGHMPMLEDAVGTLELLEPHLDAADGPGPGA